jgi:ubiquinone biosynthesis protein COQ9
MQDTDTIDAVAEAKARILAAALPNVPFDGWSERALADAVAQSGVEPGLARVAFPRGAIDLALFFHEDGDARMVQALAAAPLTQMRMREKVAFAVRTRLEIAGQHREAVRRGVTLFALPIHTAEGARALWRTADTIWTALGDASEDGNWYSKRAILAGVYSATVLYWLGDESEGRRATWAFLDRRIEGVMRFEKIKAQINATALGRLLMTGSNALSKMMRPPRRT